MVVDAQQQSAALERFTSLIHNTNIRFIIDLCHFAPSTLSRNQPNRGYTLPELEFENLLLEAIDQALTVLGESSKLSIYFHLEKSFGIKRQDIPQQTEEFASAMEKLFGPGAKFIETLVSKRLCEKAGLPLQENAIKNLSFIETVAAVKKMGKR